MSPLLWMGSLQVLVPFLVSRMIRTSASSCSVSSRAYAAHLAAACSIAFLLAPASSGRAVKITPVQDSPALVWTPSIGHNSKVG